ncbi:hypothetical protein K1T71_006203 [Dendrolimus kikuchii]|uniref:Uncharacterized protein n=1 Tax=Dendrolimus kikuchii TaxID=765133 RepID=A0ACC1D3C4_9NEOP|nr:hypothetical protein K1T71_006203 [Dendrolimus kikuchii]
MKLAKNKTKKIVAGIKLPPIEQVSVKDVKTVINIDPSYYSLVEGRPIRPNTSIQKYKHNIKNIALKRTLHRFVLDEILRIGREIETEKSIYETASKHFDEYQNGFDKFLADDNNQTIAIMKKSDSLAKDLMNKTDDHKKASYDLASFKSILHYNNETLMILLSFQNFLNKASPILWQEKHNIKLDLVHPEFFLMETDIFRSIDINITKERLGNLPPSHLYFETPEQLLVIFDLLEKQNLNYLLVTEELRSEKNKFIKARDLFKQLLSQELDYIQQQLQQIEHCIKINELREIEVKEIFFRILDQKIKYLVSSEMVLQIFNYVEFAYEQLISPNDTSLSSLDMVLALEREYDNLLLDISSFGLDDMKKIEKQTYENADSAIKQAKQAAKLLKDVDKLNRRLKSSYEPSRRNIYD